MMIKIVLVVTEAALAYLIARSLFTDPDRDLISASIGCAVLLVITASVVERLFRL